MKKITTLLILFVTVSSSFGANVISVVNTSVNAGAEFEVEIAIANDDLFNSFQFDVNFPSGLLSMMKRCYPLGPLVMNCHITACP